MSNNDWKKLAELWQVDAAINLQELTRKTRRKTLQLRLIAGFEIVAGLGAAMVGVEVGVSVIWRNPGQFFWLGIFVILLATGGTCATWWIRRGTWNAASESLVDQLRLAKQRAVAGYCIADANLWSIIPVAGLLIFFLLYKHENLDVDPIRQLRGLILLSTMAVFLVGTGIWGVWYKRKKRKEIERIEAILAEMEKD